MEWELTPKIFDDYRDNLKKFQLPDDQIIDLIKNTCQQWNKTGPGFGLQISTIDNNIHQGLAWYICTHGYKIKYYFEEYQATKVMIVYYEIPLSRVKNIKYLGKSNTIRPWINHSLYKNLCSEEVL